MSGMTIAYCPRGRERSAGFHDAKAIHPNRNHWRLVHDLVRRTVAADLRPTTGKAVAQRWSTCSFPYIAGEGRALLRLTSAQGAASWLLHPWSGVRGLAEIELGAAHSMIAVLEPPRGVDSTSLADQAIRATASRQPGKGSLNR